MDAIWAMVCELQQKRLVRKTHRSASHLRNLAKPPPACFKIRKKVDSIQLLSANQKSPLFCPTLRTADNTIPARTPWGGPGSLVMGSIDASDRNLRLIPDARLSCGPRGRNGRGSGNRALGTLRHGGPRRARRAGGASGHHLLEHARAFTEVARQHHG